MRAETVVWLLHELSMMAGRAVFLPIIQPMPVVHNRNLQIIEFLKTDCTHIFFLDSDNVPVQGTVDRLLAHNLPFVSAPSEQWKNGEHGVLVLDYVEEEDGYKQHHPFRPGSGLQKCDAVGGAGMLIRRDVLMKLRPPYFLEKYDDMGLMAKGEDFFFCDRLRELGYQLYADCDIIQAHIHGIE